MTPLRFFSRSALPILILSAFAGSGEACAQEEGTVPGAIPDPSSYQGSMELQRQSDAQDQQFRQEQQQATQQRQQDYDYSSRQNQRSEQSYAPSGQSYAPSRQRQPPMSSRPAALSADAATAAFQRGDYATSASILRGRAGQGNPIAEHNLGYLYEHGLGVPRDASSAVSWYRRSAEHDYAASQAELGRLYFKGEGVPRDPIEGYKWLLLAGRQSPVARQMMQVAARLISYDQMAEATRRAQSWTPMATSSGRAATSSGPTIRRRMPNRR